MTCRRLFGPFLILVLVIGFAQSSFAQYGGVYQSGKDLLTMDMDELHQAILDNKFLQELHLFKIKMERTEYCGRFSDRALETKEELEQLNLIRNKTTESYGQRAMEVKDENMSAIRKYKECYATYLSRATGPFLSGQFRHIRTYELFDDTYHYYYQRLTKDGGIKSMSAHIARMEKIYKMRLETAPFGLSPDEVVGTLASVHNSVEVLPGGQGVGWIPVGEGYKLAMNDHLRTGAGSMAGIQFADRLNQGKVKPTVVNVHSNSHIVMGKFTKAVLGSPPTKFERIISLMRGTLHAIKNKLNQIKEKGKLRVRPSSVLASRGSQDSFSIRAGSSTGVMRGTELSVSYDPKTGIADYHLDHGDAYVESGGRKVTLTPRTSVTVKNNQISSPRPLSQTKWDEIVTNSGGGFKVDGAVAHLGTEKNKINEENNTLSNDIEAAAKARRSYARSVAGVMLMAMKNLDKVALLKVLAEPMRSDFSEALKKTSMQEMSEQTKGRPLSHTFRCSICNRKGTKCQVLADVQMESDPIGQTKGILFDIERNGRGSGFKVADAPPVDDFMVKTFMAQNPVCGEE